MSAFQKRPAVRFRTDSRGYLVKENSNKERAMGRRGARNDGALLKESHATGGTSRSMGILAALASLAGVARRGSFGGR